VTRRFLLHPEAEDEILTAFDWYFERSAITARAFLHESDLVVAQVVEAPERWPRHILGTRRRVFPRFPFSAIYRVTQTELRIVAIAHHSRRPGYWRHR
jgi:plasmid stabilization system protein ParE